MYCKSLMIGDKVFIAGSPTRTIKHLTKRKVGYIANDTETRVYYTRPEFVFGIPLTPEILEKNGFYDRNTQWYYKRFWSNGCFDIAVALDYREIEISKVCGSGTDCEEVEYGSTISFGSDINVHELQHALRLCGLDDLADNFKVE